MSAISPRAWPCWIRCPQPSSIAIFESERLAQDLGTEVDLQLQAKYQRFVGLLKYAHYDAHEGQTPAAYQDTTKFWVQLEYVW